MTNIKDMCNIDEEPIKLNRKNILEDIGIINLDDLTPDEPAPLMEQEPEEDNAILDLIDVGLDFTEDFLKEAGYPPLKRSIWDERGKPAMNKALNAYLPAGSAFGGMVNTPLVALGIGVGCLALCFMPVIHHKIKQSQEARQIEVPQQQQGDEQVESMKYTEVYEIPETKVSSTAPISNLDIKPIDRIQQRDIGVLKGF